MRTGLKVILVGLVSSLLACDRGPTVYATEIVSDRTFAVDRIYRSMMGPLESRQIRPSDDDEPELLWIVGYQATMLGPDRQTPVSDEFMCHSNLEFNVARHALLFGHRQIQSERLFTLSQGQLSVRFPDGFGIPILSTESLTATTQVLNLNPGQEGREVGYRVRVDYVRDEELRKPMRALFMRAANGFKRPDGDTPAYFGESDPDQEIHGPGCLIGENAGPGRFRDRLGNEFIGHWLVKPGREVNRSFATNWMAIPFDTEAYYISIHIHPFAESLELVDLTTGQSVYESHVENSADRIGVERVEYYSSEKGIPIYKDHDYELISVYDNPTDADQDSMAVMFLYMEDKEFRKPDLAQRTVQFSEPPEMLDKQLVLHTSLGDLTIGLYKDAAPKHVAQIQKLVELGIYDTTRFFRVEPDYLMQTGFVHDRSGPSLTPRQEAAIHPLRAEFTDLKHRRGTVSMARDPADPDSGRTSFMIVLGDSPHLDRGHSVFGEVVDGHETLDRIEQSPRRGTEPVERIEIRSAEVVDAVGAAG